MLEQITNALSYFKDIKGFRFYFLVVIFFAFSLIFMFKEQIITSFTTNVSRRELKLRHSDNNKIRHVIEKVYQKNKGTAYILYLYQPEEPVIKRIEIASTTELENEMRLNEFVLSRQEFITNGLKRNDYILLDSNTASHETAKYHRINGIFIPYIYIYGIRDTNDNVVGEVHIWFNEEPTLEELKVITAELSETAWYIF